MKPTSKLRFVRRTETHTPQGGNPIDHEVTILQQWWEQGHSVSLGWGDITIGETKGEWRDVRQETE
jgi:hypothetical protein